MIPVVQIVERLTGVRLLLDLILLITVCAIGTDPGVMQALIWHESAGDPWSFSARGDAARRTYGTPQDAVATVRTMP